MSIDLANSIHKGTDNRFIVNRILSSIKTVTQEKGILSGSLMVGSLAAANVYVLFISLFCLEGSVRSIIEFAKEDEAFARIRPLGNAGGWTAVAILSGMALGTVTLQLVREGEFRRLKPLCLKWIKKNKTWIENHPKFHKNFYLKLNDLLDSCNSQCLFSKNIASRRLLALKIHKESELKMKYTTHRKDKSLKAVLENINSDLKKMSSCSGYFKRLFRGQQSTGRRCLSSLIMGVAIPAILLITALFSVIGEVGLGKDMFYDREGLSEIGHFGEWPFNTIEVIGLAIFLHVWSMVNEGEFSITKSIYRRHLEGLKDDKSLHNRLCEIANQDLAERAERCYFYKLPLDYQFEKL